MRDRPVLFLHAWLAAGSVAETKEDYSAMVAEFFVDHAIRKRHRDFLENQAGAAHLSREELPRRTLAEAVEPAY